MEKNVVNWFEIPVNDIARAKRFYKQLLGKDLQDLDMPNTEMSAFPMVEGGEYATGALAKSEGYEPSQKGIVVYFHCDDVNDPLEKVESLGGKVLIPKMSISENGFIAHIIDSEGNRVALHSVK
jgi:predicted enzyme related to lactoylglutathione lyase